MAREIIPIQTPVVGDKVSISFPLDKTGPPMLRYIVVGQDACHFYVVPIIDQERTPYRVPLRNVSVI